VTRTIRILATLTLAFAVSVVPLVADWCAASCEMAHPSTTASEPSCHRTASALPHFGQHRLPCGHEHHPIVVDAATTTVPAAQAVVMMAISDGDASLPVPTLLARVDPTRLGVAPSPPLDLTLATILRI
jgi:hypothetical protein